MAENRAHKSESKENRLARFKQGHPYEAIETLVNSIANYFNNEICLAADNKQSTLLLLLLLLLLGMHAAIETLCDAFFGNSSTQSFERFLVEFVDGEKTDKKFSIIAKELNSWRNILAHQWIGSLGHHIGYTYETEQGWFNEGDITFINPKIFAGLYLDAFGAGGKIYKYDEFLTRNEISQASSRIIEKYEKK